MGFHLHPGSIRCACTALALLLIAAAPSLAAVDPVGLAPFPVLENGRKKPFLVFADEAMVKMSGRTSCEKDGETLTSVPAVASLWLDPAGWENVPLIVVTDKHLRAAAGLDPTRKRFSYVELAASERLRSLLVEASAVRNKSPNAKFPPLLKSASDAAMRMALFEGIVGDHAFAILGHGGTWGPVADADPAVASLRSGIASANQAAFDEGLRMLANRQVSTSPDVRADPRRIAAEVFYQRLHPFRLAWIFYLAAGVALAVSAGARTGYALTWVLALGGAVLQIAGFACRIFVSGRAPVTNMYESVVWVAFGTVLLALIFEAIYRCRYFLLGAAPVAVVSLILADTQPAILDRSINPLVPVLADNFWLTTHVLTITLSYAAFALALGVAHIALGKIIAGAKPSKPLYSYLYRSLQAGVLLLAVGTILGGVWANYSWGRFWDWDPKETWALIALLGYLFLLHGRIAGKWGDFGLAVGTVLAFQSVIMAWYGVNFVLGVGLHSYGFGTGGLPAATAFILAEIAFVTCAIIRKNSAAQAVRPPA